MLFKRVDIIPFFQMIDEHFPELSKTNNDVVHENPAQYGTKKGKDIVGKLTRLEDDDAVKLTVDEMNDNNADRLSIIASCMNQYGAFYNKMSLTDWCKIVYQYLDQE